MKNSRVERGAKINHLSYVGDAGVGAGANIGAGTITCNYDGYEKSRTEIGEGAFIGSNTALVAPVTVGPGAVVGAGSVITEDVEADAIAVARGEQRQREGAAARRRARRRPDPAEALGRAQEGSAGSCVRNHRCHGPGSGGAAHPRRAAAPRIPRI